VVAPAGPVDCGGACRASGLWRGGGEEEEECGMERPKGKERKGKERKGKEREGKGSDQQEAE